VEVGLEGVIFTVVKVKAANYDGAGITIQGPASFDRLDDLFAYFAQAMPRLRIRFVGRDASTPLRVFGIESRTNDWVFWKAKETLRRFLIFRGSGSA
jgi:hypothetical protein